MTAGARIRLLSQDGQVLLLTALLIPVLIGFTGLAFDIGVLTLRKAERQRAADAAALAGTQYLAFNAGDESGAEAAACLYAQKNGFGDGTACSSGGEVRVNLPPTSGDHSGDSEYIEVIISRSDPTFFMKVLGVDDATVAARAVGGASHRKANYALIVLDPTVCNAYNHTSSSDITINGGGAIVNSKATTGGNCTGVSANQGGGSVVTAQDCYDKDGNEIDCTLDYNSGGSWVLSNNAEASPAPTKAPAIPDPLSCGPPIGSAAAEYCPRPVPCSNSQGTLPAAGWIPWSSTSSGNGNKGNNPTITQISGAGDITLEPGTYFGGIKISSNSATVHFKPGLYLLAGSDHNGNGGGFNYTSGNLCGVGAAGTCPVATGVTFFNTSNPYANQANNRACSGISLEGNGSLKFAAPTVAHTTPLTGYKNMLFWQSDTCTQQFKYAGSSSGASWTSTGIMYVPNAALNVTGGGNFGAVQIIVKTFGFSGSQDITIQYTRYIDTDNLKYYLVE